MTAGAHPNEEGHVDFQYN